MNDIDMTQPENRMITITAQDGTEQQVEVIAAFKFKDSEQEYMVYTQNETDADGNVTIYVSKVKEDGDEIKLSGIEDEEEWGKVKEVLRELSKEEE